MLGPGKYDWHAQQLVDELNATGIILIVVGGSRGSGMSVKSDPVLLSALPSVLRNTADLIETQVKKDLQQASRQP
jgi:tRNA A37 N6-isopentenylltransferase MiaA